MMGPVEFMLIGFDGNRFTGEIMPELSDLREKGIVRVIDLLFVSKDEAGNVTSFELSDLAPEEAAAYRAVEEHEQGWFARDDIDEIKDLRTIPAAMVLFEHSWATRFRGLCRGQVMALAARVSRLSALRKWPRSVSIDCRVDPRQGSCARAERSGAMMRRRAIGRRAGIGLLGATAVAGTAYAVGSSRARSQAEEQAWEQDQAQRLAQLEAQQAAQSVPTYQTAQAMPTYQTPQPVPAEPPMTQEQKIEQLKQLGVLKESGVLTPAEFEREKQKILAQ
jgi:hypothetical protein